MCRGEPVPSPPTPNLSHLQPAGLSPVLTYASPPENSRACGTNCHSEVRKQAEPQAPTERKLVAERGFFFVKFSPGIVHVLLAFVSAWSNASLLCLLKLMICCHNPVRADRWLCAGVRMCTDSLPTESLREQRLPYIHTLTLMLRHTANNRRW